MSPTRDITRATPTSHDLQVSLNIAQDPAGAVIAHLSVDEPDGLLVEIELTGDELALLLAGDTVIVPGQVSGIEHHTATSPPREPGTTEPDVTPDAAGSEPPDVDEPTPATPNTYGSVLDQSPAETQPITHSTDVPPGETVLAYIHGHWLDAVIARRDIGTLLVTYSRPGSFGQVQQRITIDRVRQRI